MENFSASLANLLADTVRTVVVSVIHNAPVLGFAIATTVLMSVYLDTEKIKRFMLKRNNVPVLASVGLGALTPLCACGTMALVIGLMTTTLPWGPIMAFLTSSPLMSPDGFIMLAGLISFRFAVALAISSIFIGLASGYLTGWIEKHTGFLQNQTRFAPKPVFSPVSGSNRGMMPLRAASCGCTEVRAENGMDTSPSAGCCDPQIAAPVPVSFIGRYRLNKVAKAFVDVGLRQVLLFFSVFIGIGYLINTFVPEQWIIMLFSADSVFSIPIAAAIGLPLYLSGDAAVPLIQSLMKAGAGEGAMLAFLITGQATSAWVIAGIATFMKRRAIGLYLAYIIAGGIGMGYLYELVLALL